MCAGMKRFFCVVSTDWFSEIRSEHVDEQIRTVQIILIGWMMISQVILISWLSRNLTDDDDDMADTLQSRRRMMINHWYVRRISDRMLKHVDQLIVLKLVRRFLCKQQYIHHRSHLVPIEWFDDFHDHWDYLQCRSYHHWWRIFHSVHSTDYRSIRIPNQNLWQYAHCSHSDISSRSDRL